MNIKSIIGQIKYDKFEYMRDMLLYDFRREVFGKYKEFRLFDDLNFIEYFKDKDQHFWCDVIYFSKFSVKKLCKIFSQQLMTNIVYNEFLLRLEQMNKHKAYECEKYNKFYKKINEYFYEYENYLNKFRN